MKFYKEGSLIFLGFGAQVLSAQVHAAHTHYTHYVQFILKSLSLGIHPRALCGAFGSRLPNIFWHFNPAGTLELLGGSMDILLDSNTRSMVVQASTTEYTYFRGSS